MMEVDMSEKANNKNKGVVRIVEKIKKIEVKVLREDKQQMERELVLKEEKIYVLKDKKLRMEIIQLYYDILTARHRRRQKMTELVTMNYQ